MSGLQVDLEVMQNRTKFATCQGIDGQGQLVQACPVRVAVQLVYTGSPMYKMRPQKGCQNVYVKDVSSSASLLFRMTLTEVS